MRYGLDKYWNEFECHFADEFAAAHVEGRPHPAIPIKINREPFSWWRSGATVSEKGEVDLFREQVPA